MMKIYDTTYMTFHGSLMYIRRLCGLTGKWDKHDNLFLNGLTLYTELGKWGQGSKRNFSYEHTYMFDLEKEDLTARLYTI